MILSDFCDEHGHVHTAVKLTGVSVHFTGGGPSLEQWAEKRAQILVGRRYMVVLHRRGWVEHAPFTHTPGEVTVTGACGSLRALVVTELGKKQLNAAVVP